MAENRLEAATKPEASKSDDSLNLLKVADKSPDSELATSTTDAGTTPKVASILGDFQLVSDAAASTTKVTESSKPTELTKPDQVGEYLNTVDFNGEKRPYTIYRPKNLAEGPVKVIYALDGFTFGKGEKYDGMLKANDFKRLADEYGVVVVAPRPKPDGGFTQAWQGGMVNHSNKMPYDDLNYLKAVKSQVEGIFPNSEAYGAGFSDGNTILARAAGELPEGSFKGMFIQSGSHFDFMKEAKSIPNVTIVHGDRDPRLPFDGKTHSVKDWIVNRLVSNYIDHADSSDPSKLAEFFAKGNGFQGDKPTSEWSTDKYRFQKYVGDKGVVKHFLVYNGGHAFFGRQGADSVVSGLNGPKSEFSSMKALTKGFGFKPLNRTLGDKANATEFRIKPRKAA